MVVPSSKKIEKKYYINGVFQEIIFILRQRGYTEIIKKFKLYHIIRGTQEININYVKTYNNNEGTQEIIINSEKNILKNVIIRTHIQ